MFFCDHLITTCCFNTLLPAGIKLLAGKKMLSTKYITSKTWNVISLLITVLTRGKYNATDFNFHNCENVPLNKFQDVLMVLVAYYLIIFNTKFLISNYKPFKLSLLFQIHNLFLTIISLILLHSFLDQIIPIYWKNGLYYSICNSDAWTQQLMTLYYINYLIKYYQLLDTLFLVLRHKNLAFLHLYHHGATVLLCYVELVGFTTISWVPIVLNLFVHVVMYWYYFLTSLGQTVRWKKWVTKLQIVQFILDLGFIYFATYNKLVSHFNIDLPFCGDCFGTMSSNLMGCGIITSYLVLFSLFYKQIYTKSRTKKIRWETNILFELT